MKKTVLKTTTFETVSILGHAVPVARNDKGEGYFSPRAICEALGIDWKNQHKKISDDNVLSSTVVISTTVANDGKLREVLMLPIALASGWLFTIRRVAPELQARLDQFRLEACLALDMWFRQGIKKEALAGVQAGAYEIPQSFADALELAANQARELERIRPKAAVYDHAFPHEEVNLVEFVRTLDGVNTREVKPTLCTLGYLYRGPLSPALYARKLNGQTYRVYAQYRGSLFTEKIHPEFGTATIYLTSKGKQLVATLYADGKLPLLKRNTARVGAEFFSEAGKSPEFALSEKVKRETVNKR